MLITVSKIHASYGGFDNPLVNDWKNKGIGIYILYSMTHNLQKVDKDPIQLKKRGSYNDSSVCSLASLQNMIDDY